MLHARTAPTFRAAPLPALLWLTIAFAGAFWVAVPVSAAAGLPFGSAALGGFATMLGAIGAVRALSQRGIVRPGGFALPLRDVVFSAVFATLCAAGLGQIY